LSAAVVRVRLALVRIGFALGRLRPVSRHVLLATASASTIGGNLAYIRDECARAHPEIDVRILAYRTRGGVRGRLAAVANAVRAGYALARAALVVIDDYFFPLYAVTPRSGTTVVQTWHASGAFKRIGLALRGRSFGADEALTSRVRIHANYDLCLIGSRAAAAHYAEAFGLPEDRFVSDLGIPRTDLFFDERRKTAAAEHVRRRYRIADGRRTILYAPTFRGDRVTDARPADDLDIELLARRLEDDHVLLLRLHPFVREGLRVPPNARAFVVDVSDHADINELMLVADVLVTDYSSAIFEFSLLERPMAFFAPDLDEYERERGFFFDYRSGVPGPVFETTEALAAWLRHGPFDFDRVRGFRDRSFEVADGGASRRFVERIVLPALARR
jgi:teichoic acid ribitol-phosphate primase